MKKLFILILSIGIVSGCKNNENKSKKLNVVTTTTMITDLVKNIGGDSIQVNGLMGAGVDPHLYKASEGDVSKLYQADIIFYNGLHLEGKLTEVFEKMENQGKIQVALAENLENATLIGSKDFASNYDPHVWFNITYYRQFALQVFKQLAASNPENEIYFKENLNQYLVQLEELQLEITHLIAQLPKEKRILITAHDAFNYFGESFEFEVVGLQGLSTATEAGVQDVQRLSKFILKKKCKSNFC